MQVSVETLKGLERKVTVSVPTEQVEEEVSLRLKDLARKVKVDGFRPGKVPMNVVKNRFAGSVREEVAKDMVQSTLFKALKEKELVPAGFPSVEPKQIESGKDFCYVAVFEVFPEINITELSHETLELIQAQVNESDVDRMLEKLREQNKEWYEVSRPAVQGDQVIIDFEGFVENKTFKGGVAHDYEMVIGGGAMIPGFEEALIDAKPGQPLEVKVNLPNDDDYGDLAGKEALFKINVKKIMEGKLPKLDANFAEKFDIKEGGGDALKKDIQKNMERELERRIHSMNRKIIFDKFLEKNQFDLPISLIDQEIEHLKHETFHRIFGSEHKENERIPDLPKTMFEEQAKRRVHLGLLFSEYVKKHELVTDEARVNAMIETFASAYEDPDELRAWYRDDQKRLAEVEALVMEEMVSEKIIEDAKIIKKTMEYDEVMNPKKDSEEKGASA